MKMLAVLAVAGGILSASGQVQANPFDDCVLENMRGTTSDAAAKLCQKGQLAPAITLGAAAEGYPLVEPPEVGIANSSCALTMDCQD